MYKWVQEPGVVARFMARRGKTYFSPFALREERQACVSGKRVCLVGWFQFSLEPFAMRKNQWNLFKHLEAVISRVYF